MSTVYCVKKSKKTTIITAMFVLCLTAFYLSCYMLSSTLTIRDIGLNKMVIPQLNINTDNLGLSDMTLRDAISLINTGTAQSDGKMLTFKPNPSTELQLLKKMQNSDMVQESYLNEYGETLTVPVLRGDYSVLGSDIYFDHIDDPEDDDYAISFTDKELCLLTDKMLAVSSALPALDKLYLVCGSNSVEVVNIVFEKREAFAAKFGQDGQSPELLHCARMVYKIDITNVRDRIFSYLGQSNILGFNEMFIESYFYIYAGSDGRLSVEYLDANVYNMTEAMSEKFLKAVFTVYSGKPDNTEEYFSYKQIAEELLDVFVRTAFSLGEYDLQLAEDETLAKPASASSLWLKKRIRFA